eukprot:jgi/Mesen1/422/ME000100S10658
MGGGGEEDARNVDKESVQVNESNEPMETLVNVPANVRTPESEAARPDPSAPAEGGSLGGSGNDGRPQPQGENAAGGTGGMQENDPWLMWQHLGTGPLFLVPMATMAAMECTSITAVPPGITGPMGCLHMAPTPWAQGGGAPSGMPPPPSPIDPATGMPLPFDPHYRRWWRHMVRKHHHNHGHGGGGGHHGHRGPHHGYPPGPGGRGPPRPPFGGGSWGGPPYGYPHPPGYFMPGGGGGAEETMPFSAASAAGSAEDAGESMSPSGGVPGGSAPEASKVGSSLGQGQGAAGASARPGQSSAGGASAGSSGNLPTPPHPGGALAAAGGVAGDEASLGSQGVPSSAQQSGAGGAAAVAGFRVDQGFAPPPVFAGPQQGQGAAAAGGQQQQQQQGAGKERAGRDKDEARKEEAGVAAGPGPRPAKGGAGNLQLAAFMESVGLGHYMPLLQEAWVDLEELPTLSDADLAALGFPKEARKVLRRALRPKQGRRGGGEEGGGAQQQQQPDPQLVALMESLSLGQFVSLLAEAWVDLAELGSMEEAELTQLGVPPGAAKRLLRGLARAKRADGSTSGQSGSEAASMPSHAHARFMYPRPGPGGSSTMMPPGMHRGPPGGGEGGRGPRPGGPPPWSMHHGPGSPGPRGGRGGPHWPGPGGVGEVGMGLAGWGGGWGARPGGSSEGPPLGHYPGYGPPGHPMSHLFHPQGHHHHHGPPPEHPHVHVHPAAVPAAAVSSHSQAGAGAGDGGGAAGGAARAMETDEQLQPLPQQQVPGARSDAYHGSRVLPPPANARGVWWGLAAQREGASLEQLGGGVDKDREGRGGEGDAPPGGDARAVAAGAGQQQQQQQQLPEVPSLEYMRRVVEAVAAAKAAAELAEGAGKAPAGGPAPAGAAAKPAAAGVAPEIVTATKVLADLLEKHNLSLSGGT